MLKIGFC